MTIQSIKPHASLRPPTFPITLTALLGFQIGLMSHVPIVVPIDQIPFDTNFDEFDLDHCVHDRGDTGATPVVTGLNRRPYS